jgi:hypothetical protein
MRTPGGATEGESNQAEHRIGAIKGANRRMRDVRGRRDSCACFGERDAKLSRHGGTKVGLGMRSKKEGARSVGDSLYGVHDTGFRMIRARSRRYSSLMASNVAAQFSSFTVGINCLKCM